MTSFQSVNGPRPARPTQKLRKPRDRVVKPILKKRAHSEKNSLDLDRGWDEQELQYQNQNQDWGGVSSYYDLSSAGQTGTTSAKDVTFAPSEGAASARRYDHSRSISGTSYISVATSGSGSGIGGLHRTGSTFVHPFQQTPRTASPPLNLSYANSMTSVAEGIAEEDPEEEEEEDGPDYSPTITEDDDYEPSTSQHSLHHHSSTSNSSHSQSQHPARSNSRSQSSLKRPSLRRQRTSSSVEIHSSSAPIRISTNSRSSTTPAQSSRLAHVSSHSELDLQLDLETPSSTSTEKPSKSHHQHQHHHHVGSPSSASTPMSPFSRSSFEAAIPRLRAKSDLDTATRQDHLREARRKFEAREQKKDEKYAREEIKRREKAENKRAQAMEKHAVALRKERELVKRREEAAEVAEALPRGSKHARKLSGNSGGGRPSCSLRRPTTESESYTNDKYDSMESSNRPSLGNESGRARGVVFEKPKRSNTAKRKTHGAWTMFILWLRTRILRMKNNHH